MEERGVLNIVVWMMKGRIIYCLIWEWGGNVEEGRGCIVF